MARSGGSYVRDPKTGAEQLIERTRPAEPVKPGKAPKAPPVKSINKTAKGGKE